MTEFTAEFIAEQREILLHVRRGLSVEEGDRNHHTHIIKKFSKDEAQIVDKITVADVHGFNSGHGKQIAEAIAECCNNYPEALDHIERLQARVTLLEGNQTQEYLIPPESFQEFFDSLKQSREDGKIVVKNVTVNNAYKKQLKIELLHKALNNLYEACMCADIEGELSERVNGEILDAAQEALKGGK